MAVARARAARAGWHVRDVAHDPGPIARDPIARDPIVRDPIVRDPIVRDPIARDPIARRPDRSRPDRSRPDRSRPDRSRPDRSSFSQSNRPAARALRFRDERPRSGARVLNRRRRDGRPEGLGRVASAANRMDGRRRARAAADSRLGCPTSGAGAPMHGSASGMHASASDGGSRASRPVWSRCASV